MERVSTTATASTRIAFACIAALAGLWSLAGRRAFLDQGARHVDAPLMEACRLRAEKLGAALGGNYSILAEPPFVLVSDLSLEDLARWRSDEIGPTAEAMRTVYGLPAPDAPITIALLSSEARYCEAAVDLHGEPPPTRFGYYRPARRTLVVNFSHGVGPLRHELTHALTAAWQGRLPLWLDEGLASMHEECVIHTGKPNIRIDPYDNWRLDALHHALAVGRLPPLADLIERGDELLSRDRGLFYAQARGLCIVLHERGCLQTCLRTAGEREVKLDANSAARHCGFASVKELDSAFHVWIQQRGQPPQRATEEVCLPR